VIRKLTINNTLRFSMTYLPNFNAHIFDWLKHIQIRVIFKLCILKIKP
jgi:hypothetical protein